MEQNRIIICDTRQKLKHHELKEEYFKKNGVKILRTKLFCGDYANFNDLHTVVDTKQNLLEVANNICGKEHERFRRECQLAQETYTKLIVLVEEPGIKEVRDVFKWVNPRLRITTYATVNGVRKKVKKYPKATTGKVLAKAMMTMQLKYGVEFRFCEPKDAGKTILEILKV